MEESALGCRSLVGWVGSESEDETYLCEIDATREITRFEATRVQAKMWVRFFKVVWYVFIKFMFKK